MLKSSSIQREETFRSPFWTFRAESSSFIRAKGTWTDQFLLPITFAPDTLPSKSNSAGAQHLQERCALRNRRLHRCATALTTSRSLRTSSRVRLRNGELNHMIKNHHRFLSVDTYAFCPMTRRAEITEAAGSTSTKKESGQTVSAPEQRFAPSQLVPAW